MKKCSCCGAEKPLDQYQKRKASKDGLTASCKSCLKERDAIRDATPERRKVKRDYASTPGGRERSNAAKIAYSDRNPKKRHACVTLNNYLRDGKIKKIEICESCKVAPAIEAHHCDYNKPLEVIWMCDRCHKDWHLANTPIC